jgi:maltose-binding protein MalE
MMLKTKVLSVAALAVLFLAVALSAAAHATTVPTFSLSEETRILQYTIPAGTAFNGTVSTTGSVRIWVSDPSLNQIVNLGIVDQSAKFNFTAPENGTYTFNFENDMQNTVQVSFSFTTNPQISIPSDSGGLSITYLAVTGAVAVIGSIAIILFLRRKGKA